MLAKLKSRKFWIAVFTAGALVAQGLYQEATAVVIAYLAAQGYSDGQQVKVDGARRIARGE